MLAPRYSPQADFGVAAKKLDIYRTNRTFIQFMFPPSPGVFTDNRDHDTLLPCPKPAMIEFAFQQFLTT